MYSKFHYHLSLLSNLYSVILFTFSLQQASIINFYDQQHAPGYLQRCSCSKTLVGSKRMSSIISKESKKLKESRKSIWLLETIVEHTTSRISSIFLFSPFTWQSTYQFSISMLLVYSFYLSYSSNRILDERREEKKKKRRKGQASRSHQRATKSSLSCKSAIVFGRRAVRTLLSRVSIE